MQSDELEGLLEDIVILLEKAESLTPKQRKKAASDMLKKRIKKTEDLDVTYNDFQIMISYAKNEYSTIPFPLRIEGKDIDIREQANYCMFNAVVSFLNRNEALKKLPKFKKGK